MWSFYLASGLALGLVGSLHCAGMCMPILLALPTVGDRPWQRALGLGLYHAGRIGSYVLLGALVGMLGYGATLGGWQQPLSVALGLFILLVLLLPSSWKHRMGGSVWAAPVRRALNNLWGRGGYGVMALMGALNGLLPCGLVYAGLAASATSFHPGMGAAYMAAFGIGTLPLLLTLRPLVRRLSQRLRNRITGAVPWLVGAMALLLVLRGLNLGIPYISPQLPQAAPAERHCR